MRTYDKLIATIYLGQGRGGLRASFGPVRADVSFAQPSRRQITQAMH
ncbi:MULTISPECIES: hypothetical protein [Leeia]|uniref:Uncharacterized protein n=1 Tax=Leeia aquatica TaxID=2725557 RepID=A0A847S8J7_9NEIS|nr:hypothetical protein [Leeia aquatica]NLR76294.1 hypothetical protein [Leeia aquatica]